MKKDNPNKIIKNILKNIISDVLKCDRSMVKKRAHLTNDLGANPADKVEIVLSIESELAINIGDDFLMVFWDDLGLEHLIAAVTCELGRVPYVANVVENSPWHVVADISKLH